MEVVRKNAEARSLVGPIQRAGESIGLVPTMGYLHAGHRSLMERARAENRRVVVSIFVNPTQFGPHEDFERYPRDPERDLALCEAAGVDVVYLPDIDELYPHSPGTLVLPPESLTGSLCGSYRPGHFTGVATVVAKLFALWQPQRAYFGLKDFQQTAVIRRMAEDLCFPVALVLAPTVRESDGLALSSRNVYLSSAEREAALTIPQALAAAWQAARKPGATPEQVLEAAGRVFAAQPGLTLQYLTLVEADTLEPPTTLDRPTVLAVAAYAGKTRLIDNLHLADPLPAIPSPVS